MLKRHAAANSKVSRLRRKGIDVSGSVHDIRRDVARVKSYNMAQLNKYLYELTGFTDRKTQFVGGAEGAPISKASWDKYKELERRYNLKGATRFEKVADQFIPEAGLTIRERRDDMLPKKRKAFGGAVNEPYMPMNRNANRIVNEAALKKLTADMENRLRPDFAPKRVRQTRDSFVKLLNVTGNADKAAMLKGLTLNQLDIAFNYTNMANAIAAVYDSENPENETNGAGDDIERFLSWAKTLPKR